MDSKVKYGQEIGPNLIKIAKRLCNNENLVMLLENADLDPLNKQKHPEKVDGLAVMNKLIRVVPILMSDEQTTKSKIVIMYTGGQIANENSENENLQLIIDINCPFKEWLIAGDTLRPFAIMSEIRKSLQDRRINGLGEIKYDGFIQSTITEEMGSYMMRFSINAFS